MAAISTYLANKWLNHTFRNTSYTSPSATYLALYTSDPTVADSGTEVSGGSYAREALTVDAAASSATANTSDIVFTQATGSWGTVTHFGIKDASTGGNLLMFGALSSSRAVESGDTLTVLAGDLDLTLS